MVRPSSAADSNGIEYQVDDEYGLKVKLMRADLALKQKQAFWETPRNITILVGAVSALVAAVAGAAGYKLGSQPPQAINVHLDAPLLVQPAGPHAP
jgi:hypothetical protein